jgi:hypothetical protein
VSNHIFFSLSLVAFVSLFCTEMLPVLRLAVRTTASQAYATSRPGLLLLKNNGWTPILQSSSLCRGILHCRTTPSTATVDSTTLLAVTFSSAGRLAAGMTPAHRDLL